MCFLLQYIPIAKTSTTKGVSAYIKALLLICVSKFSENVNSLKRSY